MHRASTLARPTRRSAVPGRRWSRDVGLAVTLLGGTLIASAAGCTASRHGQAVQNNPILDGEGVTATTDDRFPHPTAVSRRADETLVPATDGSDTVIR